MLYFFFGFVDLAVILYRGRLFVYHASGYSITAAFTCQSMADQAYQDVGSDFEGRCVQQLVQVPGVMLM